MIKLTKKGRITFNKSGSGSISGRLTLPSDILKLMKIDNFNREVEIIYCNGEIIIKKSTN